MNLSRIYFTILMLIMIAFPLSSISDIGWAKSNSQTKHLFVGDETVWFLAQVYYGKGEDYKKIIAANGLKSASKIAEGTMLIIPNPKFSPYGKEFANRYTQINDVRLKKLAIKSLEDMKAKGLVADQIVPQPTATKTELSQSSNPAKRSVASTVGTTVAPSLPSTEQKASGGASVKEKDSLTESKPSQIIQMRSDYEWVRKLKSE